MLQAAKTNVSFQAEYCPIFPTGADAWLKRLCSLQKRSRQ